MGDTGHFTLVPESATPESRAGSSLVETVLRWICLLTLVVSTVLAMSARYPRSSDFTRLLYDIQHGNTSVVSIQDLSPGQGSGGAAKVRWRTGLLSWHQADVTYFPGSSDLSTPATLHLQGDGLEIVVRQDGWRTAYDEAWRLTNQMADDAGRSIDLSIYTTERTPGSHLTFAPWNSALPTLLSFITSALWFLTFFGMLFTRAHSYANRWAWFWLFAIGGVGPMLLLWKEPTPLRLRFRRSLPGRDRPTKPPLTGGAGFVTAIGWAIALSVFAWGLGRVASAW